MGDATIAYFDLFHVVNLTVNLNEICIWASSFLNMLNHALLLCPKPMWAKMIEVDELERPQS